MYVRFTLFHASCSIGVVSAAHMLGRLLVYLLPCLVRPMACIFNLSGFDFGVVVVLLSMTLWSGAGMLLLSPGGLSWIHHPIHFSLVISGQAFGKCGWFLGLNWDNGGVFFCVWRIGVLANLTGGEEWKQRVWSEKCRESRVYTPG